MSFALVFSGQGTQHPAMLSWLREDAILDAMCARLGTRDWRTAAADPQWAARNDRAQTLLTGLALSAWHQLAPALPPPSAIAGYSVGELAAFSVAGLYDAQTALDLADRRAEAMDRCAAGAPGGLMAVVGGSPQVIDALCARTGLAIAIRNGPDNVVLGGPNAALEEAEHDLALHGMRCTRLRVGIASHTPWMREAADAFLHALSGLHLDKPRVALFSNAADRVHDDAGARDALARQIASTLRWDECMESIHARHVDCVLEIGPGRALARLWQERYPDVPARSCDEFRSASGVTRWVASTATR
jgi:[acyl-carrier-protein] S-malonyltransferase